MPNIPSRSPLPYHIVQRLVTDSSHQTLLTAAPAKSAFFKNCTPRPRLFEGFVLEPVRLRDCPHASTKVTYYCERRANPYVAMKLERWWWSGVASAPLFWINRRLQKHGAPEAVRSEVPPEEASPGRGGRGWKLASVRSIVDATAETGGSDLTSAQDEKGGRGEKQALLSSR